MRGSARRAAWIALGAVLLVEVVVLAAAFDPTPHNGGDNAGYLALAHSLVDRGAYLELWDPAELPHTKYPPGFPLILAGLMALGARTWAAFKIVPAAAALASVAMAFLLARRRVGLWLAAGIALLFGLSDAVVYASRWVLSDLPFLALTLLSLAALDRADRGPDPGRDGGPDPGVGEGSGLGARGWFALGALAAIAAYFTRSAGLPLVAAVLAWLVLRRMWRRTGVFALAFGLPALLWALRSRGAATAAGGAYVSEFWLVDPYRPALGTVGVGGLVGRMVENAVLYTTRIIPEGLAGLEGAGAGLLGIGICGLALMGWVGRVAGGKIAGGRGHRVGAAEIFFPLYAGLILLWPVVWSGDRFALPLFPLLLLYGVEGVAAFARVFSGADAAGAETAVGAKGTVDAVHDPPAVPRPALAILAVAGAFLVLPQLGTVVEYRGAAARCEPLTRSGGTYGCYGPGWTEFAAAAHWAGSDLPEGSAVFSRKPRIFYLLSGRPSLTFPFSTDPAEFHSLAEELGITHVLADRIDVQSSRFVVPVVTADISRFCEAMTWSAGPGGQSVMLGIGGESSGAGTPGEGQESGSGDPDADTTGDREEGPGWFSRCGPDRLLPGTRNWPAYSSSNSIPLLSPDS